MPESGGLWPRILQEMDEGRQLVQGPRGGWEEEQLPDAVCTLG